MNGMGGSVTIGVNTAAVMSWSLSPKKTIYDYKEIGEKYVKRDPGMFDAGQCKIKMKADLTNAAQQAIVREFSAGTSSTYAITLTVSTAKTWEFTAYVESVDAPFEADAQATLDVTFAIDGAITATPWDA